MKILHFTLALLFLLFAALQYNDPDPLLWMATYVAVAVLCIMAGLGRSVHWPARILAVALLVWAFTMAPGLIEWFRMGMPSITSSMKAEEPLIELVREFLGLLIALIALAFLGRSRGPKTASA